MVPSMPDSYNPYQTPATPPGQQETYSGGSVSMRAVAHLARTRPWVQFISILLFLGAGLMLLYGVGMFIGGGVLMAAPNKSAAAALPFGVFVVMAVIYLVTGVTMLLTAIRLWQYGSAIGSLLTTASTPALEAALDRQRAFWKLSGIVCIIMIAMSILGVIAAVIMVTTLAKDIGTRFPAPSHNPPPSTAPAVP